MTGLPTDGSAEFRQFRSLSTGKILRYAQNDAPDTQKSPFRELESLARTFLPVLLSFLGARIASKETALTKSWAEFRIENN